MVGGIGCSLQQESILESLCFATSPAGILHDGTGQEPFYFPNPIELLIEPLIA